VGGRLAHGARADVEGAVLAEGDGALALVELHGGDPEVEQHAVGALHAGAGGEALHLAEVARHAAPLAGMPLGGQGGGVLGGAGVLVDGQHVGAALEERAAVAAGAEGAVDDPGAGPRRERLDDLGEHHGQVGEVAHPTSSRSSSGAGGWSWTAPRFASHSSSFQISRRLGAPTTTTLPSALAKVRRGGGRVMRPAESSFALAAPE